MKQLQIDHSQSLTLYSYESHHLYNPTVWVSKIWHTPQKRLQSRLSEERLNEIEILTGRLTHLY